MADATVQAPAKKKAKLQAIARIFGNKAELDAGQKVARDLGYKPRRVRKFVLADGNGKTVHVLAGSIKDAFGRSGQKGLLGSWTATELDPVSPDKVAPTADAVLSAMSMLSDADREKIKQALAKAKK